MNGISNYKAVLLDLQDKFNSTPKISRSKSGEFLKLSNLSESPVQRLPTSFQGTKLKVKAFVIATVGSKERLNSARENASVRQLLARRDEVLRALMPDVTKRLDVKRVKVAIDKWIKFENKEKKNQFDDYVKHKHERGGDPDFSGVLNWHELFSTAIAACNADEQNQLAENADYLLQAPSLEGCFSDDARSLLRCIADNAEESATYLSSGDSFFDE